MSRRRYPSDLIRSKSWESQPEFDNLIRDIDISSLRFLRNKYIKDIRYFKKSNDLSIKENIHEYKQMQQRLKMISEELERRYHDTILLDDKDIHFSQNHNYIIESSKDGTQKLWQVSMDDIGIKIKYIGDAWNTEVR